MELRAYQNDLIEATKTAYLQGYKRPCIVLGCGGGKSVIVAELAKRTTARGNRVLFLVHRFELCEQIRATFKWWGVDMRLCQVGMVQTVSRRIGKIKEPKLIITDENHHCLANSYKRIYEQFPHAKCIGVTATPIRLNGGGLGEVNDKLIVGVSTKWLIKNKYLAPFDYYSPSLMDLTGMHVKNGDYVTKEIEDKLDKQAIYGDVIKYYRELSADRQAICYCASIALSMATAVAFNANGINACHIDGKTPKKEREKAIQDFKAGKIKILCNVDLISEGFDVPDCNTAILLRPTKSLTLYIQQSMRCMRYKDGKRAVIIDHVGNYAKFGLPDLDREWDLQPKKKGEKRTENEVNVRQCANCFFTFSLTDEDGNKINICPACGAALPEKERTVEEIKDAKLELIQGFVVDYTTPEDCTSMAELTQYAANHGYKRGWAYFQAKQRGII